MAPLIISEDRYSGWQMILTCCVAQGFNAPATYFGVFVHIVGFNPKFDFSK